jgi:hypothetical protein
MKKIMLTLASLLVLDATITLGSENGRGIKFSVKDIEKAIEESKPEKLRELVKHIKLTEVEKDNYLDKARKVSQSLELKLKNNRDTKDKMHIAKGVGSGLLSLGNLGIIIYGALIVWNEMEERPARRDKVEIAVGLGLVSAASIVAGAFATLAISEIRKGRTKFDRNAQLDQALAVEAELKSIVAVQ